MGQRNRQVAETMLNMSSSRSHAVLTIRLEATPVDQYDQPYVDDASLVASSKLSIIDLAGSGRLSRPPGPPVPTP